MDTIINDIRYGLRMLLKTPGFTILAVITLALGIGANTAIFSVLNAVVLRPLPFPEAGQLVRVGQGTRNGPNAARGSFSFPDFKDLREQTQTFSAVAAFLSSGAMLNADGQEPERVFGADVTPDYFAVMGVNPLLGRVFTAEEDHRKSGVVVISYALWQRRFGGRPDVVGQSLRMGTENVKILGVMPPDFEYPIRTEHQDFWEPLNDRPQPGSDERDNRSYRVVARIKPGLSFAAAQADLETISKRLEQQYPDANTGVVMVAAGLKDDLTRDSRPALFILLGAVGFVLLIACANVANLLLARATSRQKEIAVRNALGASRWRIVRQLLVESLFLSLAGATLGLMFASWGTRLLITLGPGNIPRVNQVGLDLNVLMFTLALALVTGVVFGVLPAIHTSNPNLTGWLNEGARGSSLGPRHSLVRSLLVVSEVALSLILLVGAGLLLKSFVNLLRTDPGFDPSKVVALDIPLSRDRYDSEEKQALFFNQLTERVRTIPGVEAAGVVNNVLLSNSIDVLSFNVAGRAPYPPGSNAQANYTLVSPGYFGALKIPLRRGRAFTDQDRSGTPPVMLVSEAFVRTYFPNEEPIGLRLILDPEQPPIEIVGVVGDARRIALDTAADPEFYVPFAQAPYRRMNLMVRTTTDNSAATVASLRSAIVSLDPAQMIWQTRTLDQLVDTSIAARRFNMVLLAVFAAVALILAVLGIYGVMTYTVRQRTHEIGIRMALGAQAYDVLKLVIRNGMTLALIGVVIGLGGAFALTRLMATRLFEVKTTDLATYASVAIGLQLVALIACYIPARRATKVDPLVALRYE
jgi:putative ABC transport system permease protein